MVVGTVNVNALRCGNARFLVLLPLTTPTTGMGMGFMQWRVEVGVMERRERLSRARVYLSRWVSRTMWGG